jgi:NADP-dependent 3-hydroxy acid dehydrogenase YdfG
MSNTLAGRTAVVTGAASGMGEATAIHLASLGARVALLSRRKDRLEAVAEQIAAAGGEALVLPVDVTDRDAVDAAAAQIAEQWGPVDLVVNAAGVMLAAPFEEGRSNDWDRMIDTNLKGLLNVSRAFTASLYAVAAEGKTADLVNVSSIGAHIGFPDYGVYMATKAAVSHLSNVLRTEFGPREVRVTNVEPGLTDTELVDHLDSAQEDMVKGMFDTYGSLSSAEIADLIGYAVTRPRHVNLRQLIVLPTRQA